MQDLSDGTMREIDPRFLEGLTEAPPAAPWEKIGELNEKLQKAKDAVIRERENQGPIFSVGEVLEIRGGKFRVHAITDKRIYLDSLPRTGAEAPPL